MRTTAIAAGAALCIALMPADARSQADSACLVHLRSADLVGATADIARLIDLQDSASAESFMLRRPARVFTASACATPARLAEVARGLGTSPRANGVQLLPAELLVIGNSAYPRDWNDGALWGGRGLNAGITAGAEVRWGPFSAAFAPTAVWQSNRVFDVVMFPDTSRSEFAHPWWGGSFDAPQRFGTEAFARIEPGQSYARIDVRGFGAGVSTENMVWGPSLRNPLMLSATAPGFAHIFLETSRPVDIWIGNLDFQLFWGLLEESEYYDGDPDNDERVLGGLLVAFQPRILDGLSIGGGRMLALTWWPELSLGDVLERPYRGISENPQGRGGDNQLITFFFRWAVAPAGLEVYGEWARDDHWEEWIGLLRNLDASQAWTLGLQKLVRVGDNALRIHSEVTHLSDALPTRFAARAGAVAFYTNSHVTQGHTHRGQLLGAPIGTGGEALFLGADYFWSGGRSRLSIERARYEDDAYNATFAPRYGAQARDTELSLRAGHLLLRGPLSLDAELGWSRRYNRGFVGLDTLSAGAPYPHEHNWSLRLGARWTPGESGR
ncbi:MAG TPA: hypothetical protein VFZ69_12070 [Longimicrobiales bacterium]